MRLSALIAAFLMSVLIFSIDGTSVSAQTKNNRQAQAKVVTKVENKTVKVDEGDNLSKIAERNQTTYKRLYDANTKIEHPDLIYPGDDIRVPAVNEQLTERQLPEAYVPPPVVQAAPVATPAPRVAAPRTTAQVAPAPVVQAAPVSGCGDNSYANYIYSRESGCRTTATNPSGCYGIGQACPASKIAHCGADYGCQNAFFTSYANSRYGGWAGAYSFWISHGWW